MRTSISVVGLGKVGFCIATLFAAKGHRVTGVDVNQRVLEKITNQTSPIIEPHAQAYLDEGFANLRVTDNIKEAVRETDVTIIIVPTPSEANGKFSLEYLEIALKAIGEGIREKESYHVVSVDSTVVPTSCRSSLIPVLEKTAGKRCSDAFGFTYSPKFIALGSVYQNLMNPDLILIGETDKRAGERIAELYRSVVNNTPPVHRVALENAELAKMALNSFITTKITFANFLAALCESMPNGDVDEVTGVLASDRRISSKCLKGGLGFGGPCFPRDNRALSVCAEEFGVEVSLLEAVDEFNQKIPSRVTEIVELPVDLSSVGVGGLGYKPDAANLDDSQAIDICEAFAKKPGVTVQAYDSLVGKMDIPVSPEVLLSSSLSEVVSKSQLLILTQPCTDDLIEVINTNRKEDTVILDCWRSSKEEIASESGARVCIGYSRKRLT